MGIVQCCNIVPSLVSSFQKVEIWAFILPLNFPAVLIIFTGRGGAGNPPLPTVRGGAGNPPFPTVRGGAGKGSKSAGRGGAGAGNILRVLIEIICCSKEISICIALSEVNLLNIHNLDRNHN